MSGIVSLQKFTVDGANSQAILSNKFVSTVGINFLYHIWAIPLGSKFISRPMCGDDGSSHSKYQVSFFERTRANFFIEGSRKASLIAFQPLLRFKSIFIKCFQLFKT